MELNAPEENVEYINTALNPDSTRQLAQAATQIDLAGCKVLFQRYANSDDRFSTFEEFESYAQEWIAILQRAAQQNKGIIICSFA
jgi:hypothetical protein